MCAILHNLCKRRNIPQPDDEDEGGDDDDDDEAAEGGMAIANQSGLAYRDHFTNTHFGYVFQLQLVRLNLHLQKSVNTHIVLNYCINLFISFCVIQYFQFF